jgi:hypothetical protein
MLRQRTTAAGSDRVTMLASRSAGNAGFSGHEQASAAAPRMAA